MFYYFDYFALIEYMNELKLKDSIKVIGKIKFTKKDNKLVKLSNNSSCHAIKKQKLLHFLVDKIKSCPIPSGTKEIKPLSYLLKSNIRIRKMKTLLQKANNPDKWCLHTVPLDEIHYNKFIMLANNYCYDIELLINYIVIRYQERENYNLDPETQETPIWESEADKQKIKNHPLILSPGKLDEKHYFYGKKSYLQNLEIFRNILNESDINRDYFNLFDTYPGFLLELNRLATIFHSEQPTSHFNLDNIVFKEVHGISDTILNIITDNMIDLLMLEHQNTLTLNEFDNLRGLTNVVSQIIQEEEYIYFSQLLESLQIVLNQQQLDNIIVNISQMIAFRINFNQASQSKMVFINYINKMKKKHKKLVLTLLSDILMSEDCIHRQGSRLKSIFVQWWFKYLSYYGFSHQYIMSQMIPITFQSSHKYNINGYILDTFSEDTNGYQLIRCPKKKKICWYYKMGNVNRWDGIELLNFTFCCRLMNNPYFSNSH